MCLNVIISKHFIKQFSKRLNYDHGNIFISQESPLNIFVKKLYAKNKIMLFKIILNGFKLADHFLHEQNHVNLLVMILASQNSQGMYKFLHGMYLTIKRKHIL